MRRFKSIATRILTKRKKALALLSGGLDSTLAVALLIKQGVDVEGVFFSSPFCQCNRKGSCQVIDVAKALGIRLKMITKGEEYIEVVRKPKHGYGKGMNPCIDCRIFMLRKAKEYAKEIGASLFITGEVLGERPMSQHRRALDLIEKESGLEGRILRPLSAKLLPETEAEKNGLVDRDQLLDISGRSRKRQIELAKNLELKGYSCPAGGCLLTDKHFARRLKDLFKNMEKVTVQDIELLKIGRHFRVGPNKIVVGRDEDENQKLMALKREGDYYFEVPECGSPITLLVGPKSEKAIMTAATLTLHYSDCKDDQPLIMYGEQRLDSTISVNQISKNEVDKLLLARLRGA